MTDDILEKHQAIEDAWYKRWQARQRERLERLFQAQGKCPHGYKSPSQCPRCSE